MNLKENFIRELAKSGENYVSGAEFAEKMGVSRNAVWKAVKSLENDGFKIDSTAKGYRFSSDNNRLSAEIIGTYLKTSLIGRKITVFESIDSTNNYAKKTASDGAEHGTVIVADTQTAGRGRLGRSFVSPENTGLYMSIIIRPHFDLQTVSLITSAVACATSEAVEKLCGVKTGIKWVNDLYMNGRKICGILTEATLDLEMKSLDYAVIGIGVNVRKCDFGEELNKTVTSVEQETGTVIDRNVLCAEILNSTEKYLDMIKSREYLSYYREREILTGHVITANAGNEKIIGKAVGIDENANLVIILDDGTERHLSSGEAGFCRIKK